MLERAKSAFDALRKVRSASNVIADSVEQIRSQIEDLKDQRDSIDALPVDQETAEERAVRYMQHQISRARQRVADPSRFTIANSRWLEAIASEQVPDFGTLAMAYLGDELIDSVTREIAEIYEGAPGVTDEERRRLQDENDQLLLDAELSEEAIIRHAEAQGFAMQRRIDADPRAILAADKALP